MSRAVRVRRIGQSGMRAFVVFAGPKEIGPFIENQCPKP